MANKRKAAAAATAAKTREQKPWEVHRGWVVRRPFNKSPNGWLGERIR